MTTQILFITSRPTSNYNRQSIESPSLYQHALLYSCVNVVHPPPTLHSDPHICLAGVLVSIDKVSNDSHLENPRQNHVKAYVQYI